jgi:hypothetical protein
MDANLIIDGESFSVSPGFLETLDEIAFANRYHGRAETLQQAVTLLYLLSREHHEHDTLAVLQYPDGTKTNIQFVKPKGRPVFQPVSQMAPPSVDASMAEYRQAMPAYQQSPGYQAVNESKYE